MNIIYIKIILLLIANIFSFKLTGFWLGLLSTSIVIYKILSYFGITKSPLIYQGSFQGGVLFTKDYIGSYSKNQAAFCEAGQLIKKFKLKDFLIVSFYYDSPSSVEEKKLRS